MPCAKTTVSRIEYRTNLMRADAPVIPMGYLVETCWDDSRWMGMLYRPVLTPNELRETNLETWPELAAPEPLLRQIFDRAWDSAHGEGGLALSEAYGCLSAFHVAEDNAEAVKAFEDGLDFDSADIEDELLVRLRKFEDRLAPVCTAQIIALEVPSSGMMMKRDHHQRAA